MAEMARDMSDKVDLLRSINQERYAVTREQDGEDFSKEDTGEGFAWRSNNEQK